MLEVLGTVRRCSVSASVSDDTVYSSLACFPLQNAIVNNLLLRSYFNFLGREIRGHAMFNRRTLAALDFPTLRSDPTSLAAVGLSTRT